MVPRLRPGNDAGALEELDLLATTEDLGDRILSLANLGRMEAIRAAELLERLLACYIEPLKHAREVAQIVIELRKQGL